MSKSSQARTVQVRTCQVMTGQVRRCKLEVEKVWQLSNLVNRKVLKNQALAESCWILFPDLEKAASSASQTCGHFVGNHAILRTFVSSNPVLFTEDGKRKVEDE